MWIAHNSVCVVFSWEDLLPSSSLKAVARYNIKSYVSYYGRYIFLMPLITRYNGVIHAFTADYADRDVATFQSVEHSAERSSQHIESASRHPRLHQ